MSNIVARSIFNTAVAEPSWKTKVTSALVHVAIIGAAFLLVVPVAHELKTPVEEHFTLLSPIVTRPHVVLLPPHLPVKPKVRIPLPDRPQSLVVAKLTPTPVQKMPVVPILRPIVPETRFEAEAKPVLPAATKPLTKVGGFEELQAKTVPAPKQVIVGGFGDQQGVRRSDQPKPQPVLMASVGSFDSATGSGQASGGGQLNSGVKKSGFGSATSGGSSTGASGMGSVHTGNFGESSNSVARNGGGAVRSTGFGDTIAALPQHKAPLTSVSAFTPVEILFKPRPSYTEEARGMRLEGKVSIEVVFQASGAVKVVRIIKGLGHGLDESAQQAALQVRFKPATRGGAPVDTNATISITFELT